MPVPIISPAQMRAWEKATWAAGQTEAEVIRRVGKRVGRRARKMTRAGDLVLILAGKGHNGEDATAAKAHLAGRKVRVLELLLPGSDLVKLDLLLQERPALIIDGIFGIGLNRPLGEAWQRIITRVNAAGVPVLAVDVPSGLNGETGEDYGAVIQARVTLTVGAPKTGLLAAAAQAAVGRLETTGEVGLAPGAPPGERLWTVPEDFAGYPPARAAWSHKGTYGHAVVVAGSAGYHGAAVLAAQGAQRAQPGWVTVLTPAEVLGAVSAQLTAAMTRAWQPGEVLPVAPGALLAGPGLAGLPPAARAAAQDWLRAEWRAGAMPLVVDASALDWLAPEGFVEGAPRVITPHPGEAARLLGVTAEVVQRDRLRALRELSGRFGGCWVVLKGQQTLIGRATGTVVVNSTGNPYLAQGGSGDLLAGFITGLLAQPALGGADPGRALAYAVWQHGRAADELTAERRHWTVEDLAAALATEA